MKKENSMIERIAAFIFALICFLSAPFFISGFTAFFGIPIVIALALGGGVYFVIAIALFYAIFIKKVRIRWGCGCYRCYGCYDWQDDATERITNPRYSYLPQNIFHRKEM